MQKRIQQAQQVLQKVSEVVDEFQIDPDDFKSARDSGASIGTQIAQVSASMAEAAQLLNSSQPQEKGKQTVNIISPVVMPRDSRSYMWVFIAGFLAVVGVMFIGAASTVGIPGMFMFGLAYVIVLTVYVLLSAYQNSYVMIPDGCKALITQFGKVVETVDAGRHWLWNPWKSVGYIVNITKEYPYNAPIRSAQTQENVEASVDLFLQFKIEDPEAFVFRLGGAQGFGEKLQNAVSEVTRALIYAQKAESIYDLIGESTQPLLDNLNGQFRPAVRFTSANITHAEPSMQEYRMDMAAAELIRVAKEAYNYEYELKLRKERDEGDLNKDLASLRQTLSQIQAEIATYQAKIDTAKEQAVNRANAYAHQLLVEAESEAKANAALLEAQSLDIKSLNSARYPEILEYRYKQQQLDKIANVADRLPQIINMGPRGDNNVDFMAIARQMLGVEDKPLFTKEDMAAIRQRMNDITQRIKERGKEIDKLENVEDKIATVEVSA